MNTLTKIQNWFMHDTDSKLRVFLQTGFLIALCYIMFNIGRGFEQDSYVKALDEPYPLRPQAYFGGLNVKHLTLTW